MTETADDLVRVCTQVRRADWEAYQAGEGEMDNLAQGRWEEADLAGPDARGVSETAGEKADKFFADIFLFAYKAGEAGLQTTAEMIAAKVLTRDEALKVRDVLAPIRAAFVRAERVGLLERALLALSGVTATLAYRAELTAEDCEELGISRRDACSYRGWCRWAQRQPDLAEAEREAKEGDDNAS